MITRFPTTQRGLEYTLQFLRKGNDLSNLQNNFITLAYNKINALVNSYSVIILILSVIGYVVTLIKKPKNFLLLLSIIGPFLIMDLSAGASSDPGMAIVFLSMPAALTTSVSIDELFVNKYKKIILVIILITLFFINLQSNQLFSFNSESYKVYEFMKDNTNPGDYFLNGGSPWTMRYYTDRDFLFVSKPFWVYNDTGEWGTTNVWLSLNESQLLNYQKP